MGLILPRPITAGRNHVRCNGLLDGALRRRSRSFVVVYTDTIVELVLEVEFKTLQECAGLSIAAFGNREDPRHPESIEGVSDYGVYCFLRVTVSLVNGCKAKSNLTFGGTLFRGAQGDIADQGIRFTKADCELKPSTLPSREEILETRYEIQGLQGGIGAIPALETSHVGIVAVRSQHLGIRVAKSPDSEAF